MVLSIGEISEKCGLSIDTLRFYEKQGLVFPKRDSNNRRFYTDEDVRWIEFVIRLKKTGMTIKNMQEYAKLRYKGDSTIPQRIDLLFEELEILHDKQAKISNNIIFVEQKIKTYLNN